MNAEPYPGPWVVTRLHSMIDKSPHPWDSFAVMAGNQRISVHEHGPSGAHIATAHLVAAAPDLFEALNLLLDKINVHAPRLAANEHMQGAIVKAELAIAKAKGGAE